MNRQIVSTLAASIFAVSICAGAVAAGPDLASLETRTANLNFAAVAGFTHALTPTQGYFPAVQADYSLLAVGAVDSGDGAQSSYAIRFTPGSANITSIDGTNTSYPVAELTGNNDKTHKLKVAMSNSEAVSTPVKGQCPTASFAIQQGWLTCPTTFVAMRYVIFTSGAQTVPADVYTVSVDAANWIS